MIRLEDLDAVATDRLRAAWEEDLGRPPPARAVSDARIEALPMQVRKLSAGATLLREWNGETHEVRVLEKGFDYRGHKHRSLSAIAREITGTRWSGPAFFGLRDPERNDAA